jgi:hypothetical protein
VFQLDARPHGGQPLEVLVDGSRADGASAWQRHARLAVAANQRPQHQGRGAHGLDQLVGRLEVVDGRAVDDGGAVALDLGAKLPEQLAHGDHVTQARDVAVGRLAAGKQRRGEDGQRRVLGARHTHLAVQSLAALDDDDLVHCF